MSFSKASPMMLDGAAVLWAQGKPHRTIAAELQIASSTLMKWRHAHGELFPPRGGTDFAERTEKMAALWNAGTSSAEIAERFSVDSSRVRQIAAAYPDLFQARSSGPQRQPGRASEAMGRAAQLWAQNVPSATIARQVGVKVASLYKWATERRDLFPKRAAARYQRAKDEWTDGDVETALALVGSLSAKAIGERIGKSKSAVLGKLSRLGVALPKRAQTARADGEKRAVRPARASAAVQSGDALAAGNFLLSGAAGIAGKALMDLGRDDCRWPVNAPEKGGQHLFCGAAIFAPPLSGKPLAGAPNVAQNDARCGSYCAAHAGFAYVSPEERVYQHKRVAATAVGAARRNGEKVSGGGKGMKMNSEKVVTR